MLYKPWNYLSLSKRDSLNSVSSKAFITGELQQTSHWIGPRRQHKDQRCATMGIIITQLKIERWRLNVRTTHVLHNIVLQITK